MASEVILERSLVDDETANAVLGGDGQLFRVQTGEIRVFMQLPTNGTGLKTGAFASGKQSYSYLASSAGVLPIGRLRNSSENKVQEPAA